MGVDLCGCSRPRRIIHPRPPDSCTLYCLLGKYLPEDWETPAEYSVRCILSRHLVYCCKVYNNPAARTNNPSGPRRAAQIYIQSSCALLKSKIIIFVLWNARIRSQAQDPGSQAWLRIRAFHITTNIRRQEARERRKSRSRIRGQARDPGSRAWLRIRAFGFAAERLRRPAASPPSGFASLRRRRPGDVVRTDGGPRYLALADRPVRDWASPTNRIIVRGRSFCSA